MEKTTHTPKNLESLIFPSPSMYYNKKPTDYPQANGRLWYALGILYGILYHNYNQKEIQYCCDTELNNNCTNKRF